MSGTPSAAPAAAAADALTTAPTVAAAPRYAATPLPSHVAPGRRTWKRAVADAQRQLEQDRAAGVSVKHFFDDLKKPYPRLYTNFQQLGKWGRIPHFISHTVNLIASPCSLWALGFSWFAVVAAALMGLNVFAKLLCVGDLYNKDDAIVYRIPRMLNPGTRHQLHRDLDIQRCCHFNGLATITMLLFPMYVALLTLLALSGLPMIRVVVGAVAIVLFALSMNWYFMGNVTFHFEALCGALATSIAELALWDDVADDEEGQVPTKDVASAYENYQIMVSTVEAFTSSFASFFFIAEFGLFLSAVAWVVASWHEMSLISEVVNSSSAPTEYEVAIAYLRCFLVFNFALLTAWALLVLFWKAAAVTQQAQAVTRRAHRMVTVAAITDKASIGQMQQFLDHVERGERRFGFRSMGITISKSLVLKSIYVLVTLLSTGVMIFARYGGFTLPGTGTATTSAVIAEAEFVNATGATP